MVKQLIPILYVTVLNRNLCKVALPCYPLPKFNAISKEIARTTNK
ncbi:hypothetical protein AVDCRST_MAG92-1673 [uncultured Coleofasciculus sp.]|uniref:Uncharacterized protein n=1 Tax=uncultured Coleofasciculus sp. TaxID=1267456 RepID=A0A6J4I8F1_9CYAN|nr:hypothetical protein AVDCRST_MAG92-1673 [uncultured Coleofasciculus sp.]